MFISEPFSCMLSSPLLQDTMICTQNILIKLNYIYYIIYNDKYIKLNKKLL